MTVVHAQQETPMSATTTILVVEDEDSFIDVLTIGLAREGFRVQVARDGAEALAVFDAVQPDLVLLDVMLPKVSGLDVCRELRTRSRVPIIMVTAKGSEIDTVVGLDAGADDYVTKPFRLAELLARVRALLRRNPADAAPSHELVRIDPEGRRAWFKDEELQLTAKEFDLLRVLVREQGKVVSREQLMREIWETAWFGSTKTLDMHISVLRRKLGDDAAQPRYIATVRGVGFRFERGDGV